MDLSGIAKFRLASQQIENPKFATVKDIVGWMGAMQAQDFLMSKSAMGIRLPNTNASEIQAALDRGEVVTYTPVEAYLASRSGRRCLLDDRIKRPPDQGFHEIADE